MVIWRFASGDGDLKAILTLFCGFYGIFTKIFSLRGHKLIVLQNVYAPLYCTHGDGDLGHFFLVK